MKLLFSFPSPNEYYQMTYDVMVRSSIHIRTFGDNFAHALVKGHDFENGEYLNSK